MTGFILDVSVESFELVLGIYFVLLHAHRHTVQCEITDHVLVLQDAQKFKEISVPFEQSSSLL